MAAGHRRCPAPSSARRRSRRPSSPADLLVTHPPSPPMRSAQRSRGARCPRSGPRAAVGVKREPLLLRLHRGYEPVDDLLIERPAWWRPCQRLFRGGAAYSALPRARRRRPLEAQLATSRPIPRIPHRLPPSARTPRPARSPGRLWAAVCRIPRQVRRRRRRCGRAVRQGCRQRIVCSATCQFESRQPSAGRWRQGLSTRGPKTCTGLGFASCLRPRRRAAGAPAHLSRGKPTVRRPPKPAAS